MKGGLLHLQLPLLQSQYYLHPQHDEEHFLVDAFSLQIHASTANRLEDLDIASSLRQSVFDSSTTQWSQAQPPLVLRSLTVLEAYASQPQRYLSTTLISPLSYLYFKHFNHLVDTLHFLLVQRLRFYIPISTDSEFTPSHNLRFNFSKISLCFRTWNIRALLIARIS